MEESNIDKFLNYLKSINWGHEVDKGVPYMNGDKPDCDMIIRLGAKGSNYKETGWVFNFSTNNNTLEQMFGKILTEIKKEQSKLTAYTAEQLMKAVEYGANYQKAHDYTEAGRIFFPIEDEETVDMLNEQIGGMLNYLYDTNNNVASTAEVKLEEVLEYINRK